MHMGKKLIHKVFILIWLIVKREFSVMCFYVLHMRMLIADFFARWRMYIPTTTRKGRTGIGFVPPFRDEHEGGGMKSK